MKVEIVALGRSKKKALLAEEAEYLQRLKLDLPVSVTEVNASKFSSLPEGEARKRELALLLRSVR